MLATGAGIIPSNGPTQYLAAALALSSGAALLGYLIAGVSLWVGLGVLLTVWSLLLRAALKRSSGAAAVRIRRVAVAGALSGLLATGAYDATRWLVTRPRSVQVSPYEAIPKLGASLVGARAGYPARVVAGIAFHVVNGVLFAVAFALVFREYGPWRGIAWGLGLECFQLTLYPGWLDVRAFEEFATVTAVSHVVYGAVLGAACQRLAVARDEEDP